MLVLPLALLVGCSKDEDTGTKEIPEANLDLTSPEAGSFEAIGDVTAKGVALHCSDVAVNGAAATVKDGTFTAPVTLVRGVNVLEATATDEHGDPVYVRNGVLAGSFEPAKGSIEDAMDLRVNQSGLNKIGDLAESMFTSESIASQITALNPVYSDSYGVWGWDAVTISADVTALSFDTPSITFEPGDGVLTVTATLPNLYVAINATGDVVGIGFDTDVSMSASSAVVTADLTVAASNGKLGVSLLDSAVTLNDFSYDTSLLPGEIEDYILVDTIKGYIEDTLVSKIDEMVPSLLDETLSGLDPSFSTELLGESVDLSFDFASADIDHSGLALGLDLDVDIPSAGTHSGEGFLSADAGNPDVDTHADVAGAISDNLLNRVLYEAWDGGMLDMRLSTDDGSLSSVMLLPLKAEEGTITIEPMLPPVAVQSDDGLEAQLGELVVTVDTPGGELGNHLVVSLNANVGLELTVEGGEVGISLGDPTIVMQVRESDWGASNDTITNLISDMLPLDTFLALLGDISYPVPSLYGIQLDEGTVSRDDDGVHTDLEVYLQ